uniref:Ubiquitin carboxyl-terminal hydrolase 47 C-terminal domain-containing protein n=1 Tax=Amphimedon queenslandica TaxID=400682 RepID=A0A1X7SV23_AMPQE
MYRYVDFHINCILLKITIPPAPGAEATPINELSGVRETERLRREGGIVMNIISTNEEKMGEGRKIQVEVSNTIKLSQLKVKLVPLVGVPSAGFKVCRINDNEEYEIKKLNETLKDIKSGSELIVRLRMALQEGEGKIQLYLLQVNDTEFCNFMMESIVAKGTPVREFKEQIIEEAKVQGLDFDLEIDKMRLRKKNGVSPGRVHLDCEYLDHEHAVS